MVRLCAAALAASLAIPAIASDARNIRILRVTRAIHFRV